MLDHTRRVEILNRHFDEVASALVIQQFQRNPELDERYGIGGRSKCLQDAKNHLCYLLEALSSERPSVFFNYVCWADDVLTHRRVPTSDLVSHLEQLSKLLKERLPENISSTAASYIAGALQRLGLPKIEVPTYLKGDGPLADLARQYLDWLLEFRREDAIRLVVTAARDGVAIGDIYRNVFEPCQREIGRLWQINEISVGQEHYCTAATQLGMAQLHRLVAVQPPKELKVLASSVESEFHDVGVHMVSDFLEIDVANFLHRGQHSSPDAGSNQCRDSR
jgi:MerR family transcriptional regulator, light-induced transcriptional regulator